MKEYKLVLINQDNIKLLKHFIQNLGNVAERFRYFNQRSLSVIENHICTLILVSKENVPLAYGHLDKENSTIWLGIAVLQSAQGKGLGNVMLSHLIQQARINNIPKIQLSVDTTNTRARMLYEKFGFVVASEHDSYIIYSLLLN